MSQTFAIEYLISSFTYPCMDPLNEHLKTVAANLFNSLLVTTQRASAENIDVFTMLLNGTIPRDTYGEDVARFVQFMYHHDRVRYYEYIDKAELRYLTLLTNGNAIAGYLGVKTLVKIERTGDRYTVKAVEQTEASPSREHTPDKPRRTRGGRGRNRSTGNPVGNRDNGGNSGRNDNNRDSNRNDNNRTGRSTVIQRDAFPMILGVNTEIADKRPYDNRRNNQQPQSRDQPREFRGRTQSEKTIVNNGRSSNGGNGGGGNNTNATSSYKDKLVARYGDTKAKPSCVIPVIPIESYQNMITPVTPVDGGVATPTDKPVAKSARSQLDDMSWAGDGEPLY